VERTEETRETIQQALDDFRAGRQEQAEAICLDIVRRQPDHADGLYLLGLIAYERRDFDSAIDYLKKTLNIDPGHADAYLNLGNALQGKGLFDEAIANYRRAADLCPGNADILNNMGVALTTGGRVDEAINCYQEAIRQNPDNALSYNNLGNTLRAKGNYEGSVQCFKRAIRINPAAADFHKNMGNALRDKGQMDEALTCYREALRLNADAAEIHYNMANLYKETDRRDLAVVSYQEALHINPYLTDARYNLGNTLRDMGRYDEAIACYKIILDREPDYLEAYNNMGVAFKEKGDTVRAIACYEKALEINPGIAETQWNLSLVYLLAGEFEEGWRRYEWRWQKADYRPYLRHFSQPLWDGSAIAGKTILLHAEQGYGDAVQFVRYVPQVAAMGADVIVEAPRGLAALFKAMPGIHHIVQRGDELPPFDVHCPLLTLPMVFETRLSSIPGHLPYLVADPEKKEAWRLKLAADGDSFKVGLVWSGNPEHKNDRNRSLPLERLVPLLSVDGVSFYSLQKGEAARMLSDGRYEGRIIDYTGELNDFADTAALLVNLDLVISVDTAVAHLVGALAAPVWLMLPFAPDWRWLLGRTDSPWYPTMRLFRQHAPGAWEPVIEEMIAGLKRLTNNRR
jgi:tetratricopeptide (TPR) repeat protein